MFLLGLNILISGPLLIYGRAYHTSLENQILSLIPPFFNNRSLPVFKWEKIKNVLLLWLNTKFFASKVLKISVILRVRSTSEHFDILTHEMKYDGIYRKTLNFFFFLSRRTNEKTKHIKINVFS